MPREFHRAKRVAQAIHRALAERLALENRAPILRQMTVTHVDVARDLGVAKVYYTLLTDEQRDAAAEALAERAGDLRRSVGREVRLRTVPQLRFVYDESIERGERLTALIAEARERDRQSGDSDDAPATPET